MGRFLVMDVVFYGSSLNYDQGSGNYQELKKITRWDGRQYTLVSRYALRYSLLETGRKLGLWDIADGSKFVDSGTGDKTVIQPAVDLLLSGEILLYPEFDLFGYLVTSLTPQAARTSPTKISHAVSMTPFMYDTQFAGNMGLAKRRLSFKGKMDINLFTMEEHETYYVYTIAVDVDQLCKNEIYLSAKDDKWSVKVTEDGDKYIIEISGDKAKKNGVAGKYIVPKRREHQLKDSSGNPLWVILEVSIETINDERGNPVIYRILQTLKSKDSKIDLRAERLKKLVRAALNLKREIKGRPAIVTPAAILIIGLYDGTFYRTFKDKIQLVGESEEEEYVEIEEKDGKVIKKIRRILTGENGTEEYVEEIIESKPESSSKKTVQVKRRRSTSRKRTAVFEITGISSGTPTYEITRSYNEAIKVETELGEHNSSNNKKEVHPISEKEILNLLSEHLFREQILNLLKEHLPTKGTFEEIFIFKDPSVEVRLK